MKINLKQVTSGIKSTVAQATGKLENIAGAAGQGAFSISAGGQWGFYQRQLQFSFREN